MRDSGANTGQKNTDGDAVRIREPFFDLHATEVADRINHY